MPRASAKPAEVVKRNPGRPSKFEPKMLQKVRKLALLGLSDAQMAAALDVSLRTFQNWKKDHPGFLETVNSGKVLADAEVAHSLFQRAVGYSHPEVVLHQYLGKVIKTRVTKHYPPDTAAATKWLHNRQRMLWQANPDPQGGEDDAPAPTKVVIEVRDGRLAPDKADAKPEPSAG